MATTAIPPTVPNTIPRIVDIFVPLVLVESASVAFAVGMTVTVRATPSMVVTLGIIVNVALVVAVAEICYSC